MSYLDDVKGENAALREENARLRAGSPVLHKDRDVVLHYREIEEENDRLRAQVAALVDMLRWCSGARHD